MATTSIEWTDATWNPVAGCTVISPGCTNCYAMRLAGRLELMGQTKYAGTTFRSGGRSKWNGTINVDPAALVVPATWKKGRNIFVNSMSDLFHEDVPLAFIARVFEVMAETPRHTYQILTKRAERLEELAPRLPWPRNVWMGASVESADYAWRIDHLRRTPAATRFLSLEPLLGPLGALNLDGIHWAIVGGESGPGCRPVNPDWVRAIRDQCVAAGVAFHFKQWGAATRRSRAVCSTAARGTSGPSARRQRALVREHPETRGGILEAYGHREQFVGNWTAVNPIRQRAQARRVGRASLGFGDQARGVVRHHGHFPVSGCGSLRTRAAALWRNMLELP